MGVSSLQGGLPSAWGLEKLFALSEFGHTTYVDPLSIAALLSLLVARPRSHKLDSTVNTH